MVKIYGRYKFSKSTGLISPVEENQCEFTLTSEHWEKQQPTSSQVEEWRCPYESSEGSDHCILHSENNKNSKQVEDLVNKIIDENPNLSRYEFLGTKVDGLDFSRIDINSDRNYTVLDFRHSQVEGNITTINTQKPLDLCFDGSILDGTFKIINSKQLGRISFEDCLFIGNKTAISIYNSEFEKELVGEGSVFQGKFHINDVKFNNIVNLSDSHFCERTTIQHSSILDKLHIKECEFCFISDDNNPENSLYGTEFEHVSAHGSIFSGMLEADTISVNSTFMSPRAKFKKHLTLEHSDINVLDLANAHLPTKVDLVSADISEIQIRGVTIIESESLFNCSFSQIRGGYIHQSEDGDLLLDFSGATVGKLKLKPDQNMGLLGNIGINSLINLRESPKNPLYNCRFFKQILKNLTLEII